MVETSATDDATDVYEMLGTHSAKCSARSTPATSDSLTSPPVSRRSRSRWVVTTMPPTTGRAMALRQNAMARAGAAATRTRGAEVDTAAAARTSRARSLGDGRW